MRALVLEETVQMARIGSEKALERRRNVAVGTNGVDGLLFHANTLAAAGQLIHSESAVGAIQACRRHKNNSAMPARRPEATFWVIFVTLRGLHSRTLFLILRQGAPEDLAAELLQLRSASAPDSAPAPAPSARPAGQPSSGFMNRRQRPPGRPAIPSAFPSACSTPARVFAFVGDYH
jgi:hypothetical protein